MKRKPKHPGNLSMFGDPVQLAMLQEFRDLSAGAQPDPAAAYREQQANRPLKGQQALPES